MLYCSFKVLPVISIHLHCKWCTGDGVQCICPFPPHIPLYNTVISVDIMICQGSSLSLFRYLYYCFSIQCMQMVHVAKIAFSNLKNLQHLMSQSYVIVRSKTLSFVSLTVGWPWKIILFLLCMYCCQKVFLLFGPSQNRWGISESSRCNDL